MLNDELFQVINGFARHTPWLHGPAAAYSTMFGPLLLLGLLVAGWVIARGQGPAVMAAAIWAPFGTTLAVALQRPISEVAEQPMPSKSLPHTMTLVHGTADMASPSAHAILAGAVAAGLFLVERRLGVAAAVAGFLMGLARVYVGLHYPSDALAGLIVGAVVTMLGFMIVKPPLMALVTRLRRTPVRTLVAR